MEKSRRNFLGYLSILGIAGISGLSLEASERTNYITPMEDTSIVVADFDHTFDPDGWL